MGVRVLLDKDFWRCVGGMDEVGGEGFWYVFYLSLRFYQMVEFLLIMQKILVDIDNNFVQ